MPTTDLMRVYASDANHAWVVASHPDGLGPRMVLRTVDGGRSWQVVPDTCLHCQYYIWVYGIDAETVWVLGSGVVAHTADGGRTWVDQTPLGMGDFDGIFGVDRETIWAALDPASIFLSGDGGTTWKQLFNRQGQRMVRVSAVDKHAAWVVSSPDFTDKAGYVFYTADGGKTWNSQTTRVQTRWYGVSFVR